ncbi:MAG: cadherin repeat domain-containing protein, partial [Pirellulaceae bacterium]|nr:cadherin repeat domain-containing protein [Pirellulaceae bacterium]
DVIGLLATVDPDIGDAHTYELAAGEGADDNFRFEIVGDQLRLADFLDLPFQTTYQLRVRSTDAGGLSVEEMLTVVANLAPTDVTLTPDTVQANAPLGTQVGIFTTVDPDPGDTHTYSLVAGVGDEDNAAFVVDGDQLMTAAELMKQTYSIRVRSTDAGGLIVEQTLQVTVLGLNQAPTAVLLSPDSIVENVPIGSVVGVFATEDPNEGDTHTYSLIEGDGDEDNAAFTIVGDQLTTAVELDHETKDTYHIRVRSTDSGGLSVERALSITVIDVNEEPAAVLLTPNSVSQETEIGDVIGLLATIDPDIGDAHTYELAAGEGADDNFRFAIVGDELRLAGELDLTTQTIYQLRVRSTDAGGLSVEEMLTVVANSAPTAMLLSPDSIQENVPVGSVVGVFTTEDPDEGDTHTYSLIEGDGDEDNAAFAIVGDQLTTAVELDYETKDTYHIRVRSTDSGGLSVERALSITVIDVNEEPTAVLLTPNSVSQETMIGDVIGLLATVDPDIGDAHTYELVEGEGADDNFRFAILGDELRLASELDLTTQTIYQLRVRGTDTGGLTIEQTLEVIANQAPTEVLLSLHAPVEEAPPGTAIGALTTTDPDVGDWHTYQLVAGEGDVDNGAFFLDGNEVKTAVQLDLVSREGYQIRVSSTDRGGLSVEAMLQIHVNQAPVHLLPDPQTTGINQELTFSAATANAIVIDDADAGSDALSVQLTPVGGTLNMADELFGSLEELNQLLDGLIFTPDSEFQGEALLNILTNDLGHNGLGGARTANDQILISVQ